MFSCFFSFPLCFWIVVCWLSLGWTQTHKASSWVLGKFISFESCLLQVLFLLTVMHPLNLVIELFDLTIFAGYTSEIQNIVRWNHQRLVSSKSTSLNIQFRLMIKPILLGRKFWILSHIKYGVLRFWASSSSTEYAPCTGMITITLEVCLLKYVILLLEY